MARQKEPSSPLRNNQISSAVLWTIQDHKSHITGGISPQTSNLMERPSYVPC